MWTISSEHTLIHSTIIIRHLFCSRHKSKAVFESLKIINQWERGITDIIVQYDRGSECDGWLHVWAVQPERPTSNRDTLICYLGGLSQTAEPPQVNRDEIILWVEVCSDIPLMGSIGTNQPTNQPTNQTGTRLFTIPEIVDSQTHFTSIPSVSYFSATYFLPLCVKFNTIIFLRIAVMMK